MTRIPSWIAAFASTASHGDAKDLQTQQRLLEANKISPERLITCKQVHGDRVAVVQGLSEKVFQETDGLLTDQPGLALGVFTADCMPIFLWDENRRVVGALHAGWRGTAKKILTRAVEIMKSRWKVSPAKINLAVGPHIQECCYEVGEETAGNFPGAALSRVNGKSHLSLSRAVLLEAEDVGIPKSQAQTDLSCTHCGSDFFSHRRDKTPQRMLSYIVKLF